MYKYLNEDKKCILTYCRRVKSIISEQCPAKAEMRPQDFKVLGLNPLMHQYICPKHFTHDQAHLANQIDYFVEHGQLAEEAFLKSKGISA